MDNFIVGVAVLVVFGVLVAGLVNMMRGNNPNLSQKLMRWRVGMQFLAIIVVMTVYFFRH
ncbi:MAG: twin transmembrane helix small protein [Hyphomicrobiales bacterium]|nr:twin transmembrane helix small protein [Hyphomicrobiales bacterium]